jgi:NAD(P)-dependent dehydrogenase (short-subunit alcohol dehydrogenase family)
MAAVVLVEGISDKVALERLAARRGRDLATEEVSVLAIGGAQAVGRVLAELGPEVVVAGLCDAGEERAFRRAFAAQADLERARLFVCDADLEDELIRALGAPVVEEVVAGHGDLRPFRTFQNQPEWRGRPREEQLRRFMGSGGSRKVRYARFLVEALDLTRVPPPLDGVLAHV